MNRESDHILIDRIKTGDEKAFEALFRAYYPILCSYATRIVNDAAVAEEIAQEVFVKMWERKESLLIDASVKNYLFRSVKNSCLNHLRHIKTEEEYIKHIQSDQHDYPEQDYESKKELLAKIESGIAAMPEKRREIFKLSRQDGLKYREIAEKLNISVKTVEAQMGLALKHLREKLIEYLPLF